MSLESQAGLASTSQFRPISTSQFLSASNTSSYKRVNESSHKTNPVVPPPEVRSFDQARLASVSAVASPNLEERNKPLEAPKPLVSILKKNPSNHSTQQINSIAGTTLNSQTYRYTNFSATRLILTIPFLSVSMKKSMGTKGSGQERMTVQSLTKRNHIKTQRSINTYVPAVPTLITTTQQYINTWEKSILKHHMKSTV